MNVLVTGGAGFIGSHVVRRLLKEGHAVRVVDNLSTGRRENLVGVEGQVDFHLADLSDPDVCVRVVDGIELVFHIAALPSVPRSIQDPIGTHRSNVNATVHLLEAGRRAGVRRVVFSSSSSVYGDTATLPKVENAEPLPRSPYAAAKLSAEQYVLAYARAGLLEGVARRYFNVFGPRQDPAGPYAAVIPLLLRAISSEIPMIIYGDGLQTRDFTYVDNVVHANLLAGAGPADRVSGSVVNIGAGERSTLLDLVRLCEQTTGKRVTLKHLPNRAGDVRDSLASLTRAADVIGYRPLVSLAEGIRLLWEWTENNSEQARIAG